MRRHLLITAAAALLFAACGSPESQPLDAGPAPTAAPTTTVQAHADPPTQPAAGATVDVTVYFTMGDRLLPATRSVPDGRNSDAIALEGIRALLRGPTAAEAGAGFGTEIPEATRVLGVTIGDDRIATVNLSAEFERGGTSESMRTRVGQVVCTMDNLVDLDIADGTRFLLDGKPVRASAGGLPLDGPVSCADYHAR